MKDFQITKTDYLSFRCCRKDFWLKKNRSEEFPSDSLSDFQLEIVKEGKDVDEVAKKLFPKGINIDGDQDVAVSETNYRLDNMDDYDTIFQAAIKTSPFYIRTDILKKNGDGWDLYEVKATTKIKREKYNNHIHDLAFQYVVCKKYGLDIKNIGVIHMNNEYVRDGDIDYSRLFITEDVTDEVKEIADEVSGQMDLMLEYLNGNEEKYCECRYKSRGNHCATFSYSNPDVPEYSVHDVSRIAAKKLQLLVDDEIFDLNDIPETFEFSDNQKLQIQSAQIGKEIVDEERIKDFLDSFEYPLYFLDYESYLPAIPWFNRYRPYQNIVFQYSLHILEERIPEGASLEWLDENLKHREFLATDMKDPSRDLIEQLREDIPPGKGSVIVWHQPFEKGRNKELGDLNPEFSQYMEELNDRIVDLKEVFSKSMHVNPDFKGKSSIKKILPVLAPDLSYENLEINNGADANKSWGKMVSGKLNKDEVEKIKRDLLVYCKQDTYAMVRIWFVLKKYCNK